MNKYFILLLFIFTSHAALADQGISDTEILVGMHSFPLGFGALGSGTGAYLDGSSGA